MMSHTYATDAQTKSGDLAVTISAASSAEQISAACASVESFLLKHSPDQSRWFFSLTFPTLICKLFGFEPQNPNPNPNPNPNNGWIHNTQLSGKLFNFLSPSGVLMNSVSAVDRLSLVKYVFPIERLPEWLRLTLLNSTHSAGLLSDLCPLFRGGRLKDTPPPHLQLNILEYYFFWFAYYPVSKGYSQTRGIPTVGTSVSKRFHLDKWPIPVFGSASKNNRLNDDTNIDAANLYLRLLQGYLRFFVPFSDLNAQTPYRSSLLHYSSGYDSLVLENAEFFVHTLIHFWILDNDFSPLPVKVCKSFGVVLPLRSVLAEIPPTPGLAEVVNVLVKYLNSSLVSKGIDHTALRGAGSAADMGMSSSMGGSIGNWNSCIQRPLYRYILRTFLFCPVETSVKSVSHVFSLWVNYMEPWAISLDEFPEFDVNTDSLKTHSMNVSEPRNYSSSWQGFVISNYLFYTSLVMHFIGFAHKFIHTDAEVIVQMITKVINILTSSRELVDLIKNVDIVFHSVPSGSSKSMLNTLYRFVPSIREQLQDWEDGLSETDADGSFLHENWNKDLKLFSTSEDGGQQLLQLLALRAESELQATCENFANTLQLVSFLKSRMGYLFGGNIIRSSIPEGKKAENSQHEIFRPRTAGNRPTTDIRYKGDWMKRPISNDEVAWLANLLVKLSGWLNEILGLCPLENSHVGPATWSYVEVSGGTDANVCGPKDTMRLVLGVVCTWLITLGREAMKFMREHGMRVNLRMLASKKVVTVVLIVIVFSALKRMVSNFSII